MRDLIIAGAGGFGRETIDTVLAINAVASTWRITGVVDDAPSDVNLARLAALGLPHLGGVDDIAAGSNVAVCVGEPHTRRILTSRLADRLVHYPTLVHPSATLGSELLHGVGLIALAGVSIGTNVIIGDHVHLNAHAVIGHDSRLMDHVSLNPNATVSGECTIGSTSLLGASSTVLQQLTVGSGTTVGAAACVTHHVSDDTVVVGVPAHPQQKGSSA